MELCQEDTTMIRRACAQNFGKIAEIIEKPFVLSELMPIFQQLVQDEQDQIRVLCLESLVPIVAMLDMSENKQHTLKIILSAFEDKSWKVRLIVSKRFAQFAESFGKEITNQDLIGAYFNLLQDSEPEVKNAAVASVSKSIDNVTDKNLDSIFGVLSKQFKDSHSQYKISVIHALSDMAKKLGSDFTLQKIATVLFELIKDDNSEVRLTVVQNLDKIA